MRLFHGEMVRKLKDTPRSLVHFYIASILIKHFVINVIFALYFSFEKNIYTELNYGNCNQNFSVFFEFFNFQSILIVFVCQGAAKSMQI